jgi:hypothetical protein
MNNPKTSIAGYLIILASVATLVSHLLGGGLTLADVTALVTALGGVGLVAAKDGGH